MARSKHDVVICRTTGASRSKHAGDSREIGRDEKVHGSLPAPQTPGHSGGQSHGTLSGEVFVVLETDEDSVRLVFFIEQQDLPNSASLAGSALSERAEQLELMHGKTAAGTISNNARDSAMHLCNGNEPADFSAIKRIMAILTVI